MAATRKSFTAFFERVDLDPSTNGVAAIVNNAALDSGKVIEITNVRLSYPAPHGNDLTNVLGTQGYLTLDWITAATGGVEVPAIKYDPGASALPSQVKLLKFPASITESGGRIRGFGDALSTYTITKAIPFQAVNRAPGVVDTNDHTGRTAEGSDVWHADGDPDTEPITLPAGYGIACTKRVFGLPMSHRWTVTVRVSGTGKTYRYPVSDIGAPYAPDQTVWALINESGSGLTLQVFIVAKPSIGEENIPRYGLYRVGSVFGGSSLTLSKHDPAADLSVVGAVRGPFVAYPAAREHGAPIEWLNYDVSRQTILLQQHHDLFRGLLHAGPIYTVTHSPILRFHNETEVYPGDRRGLGDLDAEDDILLGPTDAFAVLAGCQGQVEQSEQVYVNVEVQGYLYSPDVAGGGGLAHRTVGSGVVQ